MVAWGVRHVFGMVGHSNLGLADALRRREEAGELQVHRHPPRGRRGVRRLGLRQAHRPAGRVPDDRRAGRHEPADRAVGREGRPRAGAGADGQVEVQVLGPGAFQEVDLAGAFGSVAAWTPDGAARAPPRRADGLGLQARAARAGRRAPHASPTTCRRCRPATRRPRPRRAGWPTLRSRRPRRRSRGALDALARRAAPGDRRRPRRARRHGRRSSRWPSGSARRSSPRSRPRARSPTTTRWPPACSGAAARPSRRG